MRLAGTIGLVLVATACIGAALGMTAPPRDAIQFRVVGASNRPEAQAVKRAVRDAVLARIAPGLRGQPSEAAAWQYLQRELPTVVAVARTVAGPVGQSVRVRLATQTVPAHRLGIVAFPTSTAPALVITLGAGAGHNWWTVLFPPLALVTVRGHLVVVGPRDQHRPVGGLSAADRTRLAAAVAQSPGGRLPLRVQASPPRGLMGTDVQIRFALWDALRKLPVGSVDRRVMAWWGAL